MRRTASVLLLLLALTTSAWAQTTWYVAKTGDDGNAGTAAAPFLTIAKAITSASTTAIDEIIVGPGIYQENLTINKNLKLLSSTGRSQTTIEGSQSSSLLGTIVVSTGSNGVVIGDATQGFKIIGIDGTPGLEKSAIYLQGVHTNMIVRGNELVANGDEAFMSESGGVVSYITIDGNIISGQTFTGSNPAGSGFADQFTLANVPRQLVVMGGGSSGTTTQYITFTNNTINGIAGGYNTSSQEQGNTLVTIDADNSSITGNTFAGTTTRYASSLRCRRPNTTISGNTFSSANLTSACTHLDLVNATVTQTLMNANTFDKAVYVIGGNAVGLSIQAAINAVPVGTVINVAPGTYAEALIINKGLTIQSAGGRDNTIIDVPFGTLTTGVKISGTNHGTVVFDGFTVKNFTEGGIIQGMSAGAGTAFKVYNCSVEPYGAYLRNGIQVSGDYSEVKNNHVVGQPLTALWSGTCILVVNAKNVTVEGNTITGDPDNGIGVLNWDYSLVENVIIRNNTVDAADYAVVIEGNSAIRSIKNITITDNVLKNSSNGSGLIIQSATLENLTITGNTITGNANAGIGINGSDVTLNGTIAISGNSIFNNTLFGVQNGTTTTIDARNNWWGANSGPYHSTNNASGTGNAVSDYVLFEPWTGQIAASAINVPYTLDSDQDGFADVKLTFNTLPAGGGNVYISRYSTIPTHWPAPPANTLTNTYVILTTDMPNYQFDVNVVLTYLGSGFGANTQAAYYNEDTEEWIIIGGTYTDNGSAGLSNDDTYAFRTNHFTPFVFINTPSTPLPLKLTDMMVSDAYDESTIPSTPLTEAWQQWMGGGNLTNDWSWEYQNNTVSVIPMTDGAEIFAATVTLRYNPADWQLLNPTGYVNGTKVGSLFTTPNYATFFYQLPSTVSTDNTILADVSIQEAGNPMGTADTLKSLMDFAFKPLAANPSPITFLSAQVRDNLNQPYYLDLSDDSKGRIYLGDFVASSTVQNVGDGLIDIDDLTVWAVSYFSDVSGVTYPGSLGNYKLKYDVGPTSTNYIDGMPEPDGKIEFEDLVIFAISYGLSSNGSYPKAAAPQLLDLTLAGDVFDAGEYVDVPVRIAGATDLRALSMSFTYDANILTFDGAVHGALIGQETPLFVKELDGSVRIDIATFTDAGFSGSDDVVILRFRAKRSGKDGVRLVNALARDSRNTAITLRSASAIPESMTLEQNYPNPFNPTTNIRFSLPEKSSVELAVFDMLGRKVRTLVDASMSEGIHNLSFDGLDNSGASLPSGVYLYRLIAGDRIAQRSMMLSK